MGACVSRNSDESELAKQVLGSMKADPKTVRRLSALGVNEGEVWVTRQTSDIRKAFRFGPQLNKGQFGTIHVVTNSAGDKFACKQISKRKLVGSSSIRDVRREIEIMHHLRGHPNVINFHGAYEDVNDVYLVMELCTGGDLFERIEKITTITERAAASLFRELVETVSYCHTLGVVHRDLKPENFLITDRTANSRIKLADFGLSCFFQDGCDQELHDVVGSAYYMAPEVIRRQYGSSCDTWSLGVILHILLAGSPPFTGSTDADIMRAVRTQEVDLTVSPWPSVSRHARHLVSKMLEKDLDKRIRLDQVLSHPWLRPDGTAPPRALHGGLRDRISQFRALNVFKREARRVLAGALPAEEVSGLKLLFEALDQDQDGLLSLEELREGLERRGELQKDTDVRALLKAADLNCDGFVDYREFVAATYTLSRMQRSQVLLKAFQHFDLDGDGYITKEELSAVLAGVPLPSPTGDTPGSGGPGAAGAAGPHLRESVSKLMAEADLDADGRVDYREFCSMLLDADGLVLPMGLPGQVGDTASRGAVGKSCSTKRRDPSVRGMGEADGSSGAVAVARRALSSNQRGASVGSSSDSSRGGGAGGNLRPSQPSPALVTASSASPPPPPPPLQGRASWSVHGQGGGWSPMPFSAGPPPAVEGCSDDERSSEDSVLRMSAAAAAKAAAVAPRRHTPPMQLYGEPGAPNGVLRNGLVMVSER